MGTQIPLPWDVTAGRHKGNPKSVAANRRISPHKQSDRERIRIQIAAAGFAGLTLKEIRIEHPTQNRWKLPNEFSGRITALKIAGEVFDSGRERNHCAVLVARREWVTPQ